jgi:low affinity Fe/Cu permease
MAGNGKSRIVEIGGQVSEWVSTLFAHPYMQIGVITFCLTWFALKLDTNLLTAALSILAITLTQMVLNRQTEREVDDRRRDVAMHAKLDELLFAMKGARDEMAGIEEFDEEDIVELKENIKEKIEELDEELQDRAQEKDGATAVAS